MAVAHVIASLDVVTAADELKAIAALRTRLLAGLRDRTEDRTSLGATSPEKKAINARSWSLSTHAD